MFLLNPRFFALPLIALAVIMALPRPDGSNAQVVASRPMVQKAVTCSTAPARASCIVAASTTIVVR